MSFTYSSVIITSYQFFLHSAIVYGGCGLIVTSLVVKLLS